jgi:hypothetical protein
MKATVLTLRRTDGTPAIYHDPHKLGDDDYQGWIRTPNRRQPRKSAAASQSEKRLSSFALTFLQGLKGIAQSSAKKNRARRRGKARSA